MIDKERTLYAPEETDTHVRCRICGKMVKWERSRLFWSRAGTIRTCSKGDTAHGTPPAVEA